ncbi:MAG: hypothetical protein ACR2QJ_09520 [Geminicoccaceae bacterium]
MTRFRTCLIAALGLLVTGSIAPASAGALNVAKSTVTLDGVADLHLATDKGSWIKPKSRHHRDYDYRDDRFYGGEKHHHRKHYKKKKKRKYYKRGFRRGYDEGYYEGRRHSRFERRRQYRHHHRYGDDYGFRGGFYFGDGGYYGGPGFRFRY